MYILLWVGVVWASSGVYAQSLLMPAPTYDINQIATMSLPSWTTNQEVDGRNGYCSLIARKNQQSIAELIGQDDHRALRGNAIDIINRGRTDPNIFWSGDRDELQNYLLGLPDVMADVYSYTIDTASGTVYNPETFSYRSPHRATVYKQGDNIVVLDPLRGEKTSQGQGLEEYLQRTTQTHHRFLLPKNFVYLGTHEQAKPPLIYADGLMAAYLDHLYTGKIKYMTDTRGVIQGIVFIDSFWYLNPKGHMLMIRKGAVVWFDVSEGPGLYQFPIFDEDELSWSLLQNSSRSNRNITWYEYFSQ